MGWVNNILSADLHEFVDEEARGRYSYLGQLEAMDWAIKCDVYELCSQVSHVILYLQQSPLTTMPYYYHP